MILFIVVVFPQLSFFTLRVLFDVTGWYFILTFQACEVFQQYSCLSWLLSNACFLKVFRSQVCLGLQRLLRFSKGFFYPQMFFNTFPTFPHIFGSSESRNTPFLILLYVCFHRIVNSGWYMAFNYGETKSMK